MSKFNQTNTMKTTNQSGHVAYDMFDKDKLVTQVLTSLFGEEKFYGDNTNEMVQLAEKLAVKYPRFVSNLARYARKEMHLRSVSHALSCVIAKVVESKKYIKETIADVVERADDITEILACYISMYGKPIPNGLKKALGKALKKFNEYQISKYSGGDKKVKFKDVLKLTHAKPENEKQQELFNKIINDNLETATRWETELSAKGNTKEVWEELIAKNQLGYMALLRNLRNIINTQPNNIDKALEKLTNKEEVLKSKQLPFRFYSAYNEINKLDGFKTKYLEAIETALELSIENLPKINGKTVIAIDVSGSMDSSISSKSKIRCIDLSRLLGVMATKFCDEALVMTFNSNWSHKCVNVISVFKKGGMIQQANNIPFPGGGTPMEAPFEYLIDKKIQADRIIILSDNVCNNSKTTIQTYVNEYRKQINNKLWVHAIDLQGYGTQQFIGDKTNIIAGWSEKIFEFINLAEEGIGKQVQMIEDYHLKHDK